MIVSIIQTHFDFCTIFDVRKQAKRIGIPKFSKLNKQTLIYEIMKYYAVVIIQRRYRKHVAFNNVCPISLELIKFPCWSKKIETGRIYYNIESLANYLITSGNFKDPSTRVLYTDEELASMDKMIKENDVDISKSVLKSKLNIKYYRKIKDNDEQIDILNERIRHITWTIRDKIEGVYMGYQDIIEFTNILSRSYFPSITEYIEILDKKCKRSRELCFHDMKVIIQDIKYDCPLINHLKDMVLDFIQENIENFV